MQEDKTPQRIHPLIAAAAISVIAVSAAGVAALTGVLPHTRASSAAAGTPVAPVTGTAATVVPLPASTAPVAAPAESAPAPVAAPATVSPKPKRRKTTALRTPAPVEDRGIEESAAQREDGPSQIAQAPRPSGSVAANVGTVESVREIAQPGEGTGLGAIAGGVLGGVLGNQFGGGNGRKILTVAGAAGGAYAGHQVEKQARGTTRWEISVRLDSGALRTLSSDSAPVWRTGDRVRVVNGRLEAV
jgi:outer membrane lipoprotein SlyB